MRLAIAALSLLLASGAAATDVAYLHVEANEGGSSGGHVALRIGDAVFHYQHADAGVLRLDRDTAERFEQRYRLLDNRTIHAIHLDVDDDTAERLRAELTRRYLVEAQQRGCLAALAADVALLRAMRGEPVDVRIAGAGLFADAGGDPALTVLRDRARDLTARAADVRRRLAALRYDAFAPPAPPSDTDGSTCYGFAQRFEDGLAMLRALDVLSAGRPLHANAIRALDLPLRADERAAVASYRDALLERLVRLVPSDRPGAGFALLVGMARLVALGRTLDEGRWTVLDGYASDAPSIDSPPRDVVAELIPRARHDLDVARADFVALGADGDETALGDVESAANRLAELVEARDDGRPLRIQSGALLPSRSAAVDVPRADVGVALATARTTRDAWDAAFVDLHRYQLVTRNCVTELFAAVDAVTGATDRGPLDFIPFVAAASVAGERPIEERPSYRRMRLAAIDDVASRLRETNTLTTTIYRPNPADSVFLFFTDDMVAPRPLFGLANLAVGLGASVAGLATLPIDRGALLKAGAWGAVWSLPELVFVNIRKGSFALPQSGFTSNTSTSAAVRATSDTSPSSTTAAPSPASSVMSPT